MKAQMMNDVWHLGFKILKIACVSPRRLSAWRDLLLTSPWFWSLKWVICCKQIPLSESDRVIWLESGLPLHQQRSRKLRHFVHHQVKYRSQAPRKKPGMVSFKLDCKLCGSLGFSLFFENKPCQISFKEPKLLSTNVERETPVQHLYHLWGKKRKECRRFYSIQRLVRMTSEIEHVIPFPSGCSTKKKKKGDQCWQKKQTSMLVWVTRPEQKKKSLIHIHRSEEMKKKKRKYVIPPWKTCVKK